MGKAARDAVESYENGVKEAQEAARNQKQQWADSIINDDDVEESDEVETLLLRFSKMKLKKSLCEPEVPSNTTMHISR